MSPIFLFSFFCHATQHAGILVPRPGIESAPPAVEALSLNHWTTREVPIFLSDSPSLLDSWCSQSSTELTGPVSVSWGCHNQVPQTGRLKQQTSVEYFLIDLEAGHLQACRWPSYLCIFTRSPLCACLCPHVHSYWIKAHPNDVI